MRKPVPFRSADDGLDVDFFADIDSDGAGVWPGGGLCCPNDPLDDVMGCLLPALDDAGAIDELLGVGTAAPPPPAPPPRPAPAPAPADDGGDGMGGALVVADEAVTAPGGGGVENVSDAAYPLNWVGPEEYFDVDSFFADGDAGLGGAAGDDVSCLAAVPPSAPAWDTHGDRDDLALTVSAPPLVPAHAEPEPSVPPCALLRSVPPSAPPLMAHAAPLRSVPPSAPPPLMARAAQDRSFSPCAPPLLAARDALGGFAPDSAPPPPLMARPAPGRSFTPLAPPSRMSRDASDGFARPDPAPAALPAHRALDGAVRFRALPAASWPTSMSSTSSVCAAPSMTTTLLELEAPPDSPPRVVVVPRRKRHRPVTRRNPLWLLNSPLHLSTALSQEPAPRVTDIVLHSSSHKIKKKKSGRDAAPAPPRRRNRQRQRECAHCSSTETPQWRAGPDGPGTLCNACGIRYKNGKLLEEYRPSTSPTFETGKHSNRHRKVVKLRERNAAAILREMPDDDESTVLALPPPPPTPPSSGAEFMDVCTYISTGC